jgi:hypothetical protein
MITQREDDMYKRVAVVALVALIAVACSNSDTGSGFDAGGTVGCCQPSASPSCCMVFGGWSSDGQCPSTCDGIPNPDQGWKMVVDAHGCKQWEQPYSCYPIKSGPSCCGAVVVTDSGSDAPADGPVDAPGG